MKAREDSPERRTMGSNLAFASMMLDAGIKGPYLELQADLREVSEGHLELRYRLDSKNEMFPHLFIVMDVPNGQVWDHFRFSGSNDMDSEFSGAFFGHGEN
jgi:hypothetical protein